MAAIELQKGWWRIVFRYSGQKYQRALDTCDQDEAKALKARLEENLKLLRRGRLHYQPGDDLITVLLSDGKLNAVPKVAKAVTLGEFFKQFQANRPPGKEGNTSYTEDIHIAHLLRLLGPKTLAAAVPAKLQDYINARSQEDGRRGEKVSHVTTKKELSTLSSIWNRWGLRKGLVPGSLSLRDLEYPKRKELPPFQTWEQIERRISRSKMPKEDLKKLWDSLFLTASEIDKFLEYVRNPRLPWKNSAFPWVYPMFVFAAHTGARRSEMIRSRIDDIDFETGEVVIREKKKDHRKAETNRRVPMTQVLREALEEWLKIHPGGSVTFCKNAGEETSPQMMHHYLRWTLDKSKWKVIRGWHTLRHSFVSNLASKGVSERIIMELAGHLNPDTTRRYAHLIPSTMRDTISRVFGNGKRALVTDAH